MNSKESQSKIEITWNNLTVRSGSKLILDNVCGQIKAGTAMGLLGPSGCGKTTLINVLTGNCESNLSVSGNVFFNGERLKVSHIKNLVSYVSQELHNYTKLTALEILEYYSKVKNSQSPIEVLRDFGLAEQKNTTYERLSGGQKLRLSIGVAILLDKPIIVLDEPTSGLDSSSAMIVIEKMEELAISGKTLLISIHQPSEEILQIFDGFILMSKGNVAFQGTISEATEHFKSLGFENQNSSVNSAEFFSRLVSIDFRSKEKIVETSKIVEIVKNAWIKKNIIYKPNNESIDFKNKTNLMTFNLSGVIFKMDYRKRIQFIIWILFILIVSGVYIYFAPKSRILAFQIYFYKFYNVNGDINKYTPDNLKNDDIYFKKYQNFSKEIEGLNFIKITEEFKNFPAQEAVNYFYKNGMDFNKATIVDQVLKNFIKYFILFIFAITTSSIVPLFQIFKSEFRNGIFNAEDLLASFLSNAFVYMTIVSTLIFSLFYSILFFNIEITFKVISMFLVLSIFIYLVEVSIVLSLNLSASAIVNLMTGIKTLLLLGNHFAQVFFQDDDNLPLWKRICKRDIFELFEPALYQDGNKDFLKRIVILSGLTLVMFLFASSIIRYRFSSRVNYSKAK